MPSMRAAVLDRYGPPEVLRIKDVERPVPGRGEVLVRVHAATVNFSRPNVEFLADLMASGEYMPVIDRSYPLDEVVEANHYVESERKTGNVVLSIGT